MKKYFIAGIGTDVGKTIASAVLCQALNAEYWKPIQSGAESDSDKLTVASLLSFANPVLHKERYLLKEAASPHFAAQKENVSIQLSDFQLPEHSAPLIIESAGGVLVPFNANGDNMIDLAQKLDSKVILVVRQYLGCINHAMLSIEALKNKNIDIAGLIFSGDRLFDNYEYIVEKSKLPVIVEIPHLSSITKKTIALVAKNVNL